MYKVDVQKLKAEIVLQGLNIGTVSEKMKYSRNTVSGILHGKDPTYKVICAFMSALSLNKEKAIDIFFAA